MTFDLPGQIDVGDATVDSGILVSPRIHHCRAEGITNSRVFSRQRVVQADSQCQAIGNGEGPLRRRKGRSNNQYQHEEQTQVHGRTLKDGAQGVI